ncbi:hypothetical protein CBM2599_B50441 [Cupriavidus taiwanensis]|nr:hypothetical protein CBM2600_B10549 [Cupriavidus taiwanensis]SOY96509.1 hypothetical protein CBM2599_B50441 [Cupriavidus taiwanensis]
MSIGSYEFKKSPLFGFGVPNFVYFRFSYTEALHGQFCFLFGSINNFICHIPKFQF